MRRYNRDMRLALLADIHGNLPALQAVLTDLGRFAPDGLIAAGDYLALPWTEECLAVLRSYPRIWMIQGNGEIGALQYADG